MSESADRESEALFQLSISFLFPAFKISDIVLSDKCQRQVNRIFKGFSLDDEHSHLLSRLCVNSAGAVSYTHLDVYKRQELGKDTSEEMKLLNQLKNEWGV